MKSYLRYAYEGPLGIVASPGCNIACTGGLVWTGNNECIAGWDVSGARRVVSLTPEVDVNEDLPYYEAAVRLCALPGGALAAGYEDGHIRYWEDRELVANFSGHRRPITAMCASIDGAWLASAALDKAVILWDLETRQGKFRLPAVAEVTTAMTFFYPEVKQLEAAKYVVEFSVQPSFLITAGSEGFLRVWDLTTQSLVVAVSTDCLKAVHSLCITPDQEHLIVGLAGNTVEIFELAVIDGVLTPTFSGSLARTNKKKVTDISLVALAPRAEVAQEMQDALAALGDLKRMPDGRYIHAGSAPSWYYAKECCHVVLLACGTEFVEVMLSYDPAKQKKRELNVLRRRMQRFRQQLKAADAQTEVESELRAALGTSWDRMVNNDKSAKAESLRRAIDLLKNALDRKQANSRKRGLAEADEELAVKDEEDVKAARSFAVRFRMLDERLQLVGKALHALVLTVKDNDAAVLFSTAQNNLERYVFDLSAFFKERARDEADALVTRVAVSRSVLGACDALDDSPTSIDTLGRRLVALSKPCVSVWDTATRRCIVRFDKSSGLFTKGYQASAVVFSPRGRNHLVVGDFAGGLSLIDYNTATCLTRLERAHDKDVRAIYFFNDGRSFVTIGGQDKTLKVWSLTESEDDGWQIAEELTADLPDKATCVSVSPDNRLIGVGLINHSGMLLYSDTLRVHCLLYGHTLPLTAICFSYDSTRVITAAQDRYLKVWDAKFANILKSLLSGREGHPTSVACLHDEHVVFAGLSDSTVQMWDGLNGDKITTLKAGKGDVRALAFTANRDVLYVACGDFTIKEWSRTEEQMFVADEREKELGMQLAQDASRGDKGLPTSGARDIVMHNKPTVKDAETIKSLERLVQVIEDCRDDGEAAVYKIIGQTREQYLLNSLVQIPSERVNEVLIGLPFSMALEVLRACAMEIERYAQLLATLPQATALLYMHRFESFAKISLALVHVHRSYLVSEPEHVRLVRGLAAGVRTLLRLQMRLSRRNKLLFELVAAA